MTINHDIPPPYEKIPLEERPLLIDDITKTLTEEGKKHIDAVFPQQLKRGIDKARRFYDKIDPLAQEYIIKKYFFQR